MSLKRSASASIFAVVSALYALFCAAMLFAIPRNRYEWMLEDPAMRGDGLTFCTLPIDHGLDARIESFAYLVPLLVVAAVLSVRRRRPHWLLWVGLGLVLLWGARFVVLAPSCPVR
ncbi:hypothetical protein [Variovorax sp. UC74_104]|uniref:hypothetical protein n=1 Tax=Variovorax sp. UC74_104 TaxID=3374555 RepID=UPI003757AC7B